MRRAEAALTLVATLVVACPVAPTAPANASEVIPRLWQGGAPRPGNYAFDLIVLSASEYQPSADKFPGAELLRVPLPDDWRGLSAAARKKLYAAAADAAEQVAAAHRAGKRVLVTCGAGLNRSGLITGLALRALGHTGDDAIALIRRARGPHALGGKAFPAFIRAYQPRIAVTAQSPTAAAAAAAATAAALAAAASSSSVPPPDAPSPGPPPSDAPPPGAPPRSKLWAIAVAGTALAFVGAVVLVSEARR